VFGVLVVGCVKDHLSFRALLQFVVLFIVLGIALMNWGIINLVIKTRK
jgi:hypothetical protein